MSSSGWSPTSMPRRETQLTIVRPDYATHGRNGQHGSGDGSVPSADGAAGSLRVAGGQLAIAPRQE
jgi:hypothetical protein